MKLNVGCGEDLMPDPWVNLDKTLPERDDIDDFNTLSFDLGICTLGEQLPFEDNSVDEILMSHVLEHLSNPLDVMEELHRVAVADALCTVKLPYGSSDSAWEDPDHKRPYFLQSFEYFGQPCYHKADYGYRGDWMVKSRILIIDQNNRFAQGAVGPNGELDLEELMITVQHARNIVAEFYVELLCVKPIRPRIREMGKASPVSFHLFESGDEPPVACGTGVIPRQ